MRRIEIASGDEAKILAEKEARYRHHLVQRTMLMILPSLLVSLLGTMVAGSILEAMWLTWFCLTVAVGASIWLVITVVCATMATCREEAQLRLHQLHCAVRAKYKVERPGRPEDN